MDSYYNLCILSDVFHLSNKSAIEKEAENHKLEYDTCGNIIKVDGKSVKWEPCLFYLEG